MFGVRWCCGDEPLPTLIPPRKTGMNLLILIQCSFAINVKGILNFYILSLQNRTVCLEVREGVEAIW